MYKIQRLPEKDWPERLKEIPDPPEKLFFAGRVPDYSRKFLCVVGSRKYTGYGKEACEYLISGLKNYPVTIISGLALGIDSIAHRAALNNNLPTIAMPGSGLNPSSLHPRSHVQLAEEIIGAGGTLISEMEPNEKASLFMHDVKYKQVFWSFPRRNRLMVAVSHAVLVIEAGEKSGTLITARLASEYNRELLAVPGNIFSSASEGANMLLRLGASLVRNPEDIIETLGLNTLPLSPSLNVREGVGGEVFSKNYSDCSTEEKKIIELLEEPLEKNELIRISNLPASQIQSILTLLEIKGHIKETLGEIRLC